MQGLKGKTFLDKSKDPNNPTEGVEARDAVTFGDALVDSVYKDAPERVVLEVGTGLLPRLSLISCMTAIHRTALVFALFSATGAVKAWDCCTENVCR